MHPVSSIYYYNNIIINILKGCGHCKALAPEWEKLAKNMQGILKIGAVNCDEQKELAAHFGIQGLLLFI